jgi:hypothetical protein
MDQTILARAQQAVDKGRRWLGEHESEIIEIQDLSAHYKALYLYTVLGDPSNSRNYVDLLKKRYLQTDGDFRTTTNCKGWIHLPCSPANRYVYSNGWIVTGLRKAGAYGLARRGIEFIKKFHSKTFGGFYSSFDLQTGKIVNQYLDSSSTSSAGIALLACGLYEEAIRAGDFILSMLADQPEPDRFYYSSCTAKGDLRLDVWGEEDQNAVYGRKQYCLSSEAPPKGELIWLIGKPMKFLSRLYDYTRDRKYLDGARVLYDFFHKLGEERWQNYASCKVMWAAAELYRHTGDQQYQDTAEKILNWLCQNQYADGLWVHNLWYTGPEEQPFAASLDLVQELCAEIQDTLFDLF